jgi:hypothetical protein
LDGESEGTECLLGVENPFNGDENVDELAYDDDPDWKRFVFGGDEELGESKTSRGRLSMGVRTDHRGEMETESRFPCKFEHDGLYSERVCKSSRRHLCDRHFELCPRPFVFVVQAVFKGYIGFCTVKEGGNNER